MKKYMKPMMQSEAFVSNEYVSTCYYIDCTGTDCTKYDGYVQVQVDDSSYDTTAAAMSVFKQKYGGTVYSGSDDNNFIYVSNTSPNDGCTNDNCAGNTDSSLNWFWQLVLAFFGIQDWTKQNVAHHHLYVVKTNSSNYPAHPNHS